MKQKDLSLGGKIEFITSVQEAVVIDKVASKVVTTTGKTFEFDY